MIRKFATLAAFAAAVFSAGFWLGSERTARADANRVFELRTYHCYEGKLPNLLARFRDHTTEIFRKHGMTNIGYWVPMDEPASKDTLVYVLAYPDRESAKKSWDAFREDPEWKKVQTESELGGKIVKGVDSVYMTPTDFSKIK
jgi:hypothetical protein